MSDAPRPGPYTTVRNSDGNGATATSDLPVAPVVATVTVPPRVPNAALSERVRALRLPNQVSQDRVRSTWLPWTLCLLLGVCVAALLWHAPAVTPETQPATVRAGTNSTLAPTASEAPAPDAVAASGALALESKGYIMPAHKIQVSPKVAGMVVKFPVTRSGRSLEEGLRVEKGEVLAQLETIDYEADRDRAKATLEVARQKLLELERGFRPEEIQQTIAELQETEAQRDQLLQDWKRNFSLKSGNALAAKEYEQAYSQYKAMDRRVDRLRLAHKLMVEGPREERKAAARAEVQQAEADLTKAQWRLDNCTVRAPVTGTILTKKAEEGDIVNPVAFNVSASLCEMADLSDLEVTLDIQERDVAKVFQGQKCEVRPDAFPKRVYKGVVSRLMPIADQAKGAIPVRVKVEVPRDEEGVFLKPNMGVVVSFLKGESK